MEIITDENNLAITRAEADIYSEKTGRRYSYGKYVSLIRPKLSSSEYKKLRKAAEKCIKENNKPEHCSLRKTGLFSFSINDNFDW